SAPPCCRGCRRTAGADGRSMRGRAARLQDRPLRIRCVPRDPRRARVACWRAFTSHPQPLDHAPVAQVLVDDLVDVALVDIGVPDRVGVDDHAGALLAAVEAAGLVDSYLALAGEPELFHALLGVVAHLRAAARVAAGTIGVRVALVTAEENVLRVIG